MQYAHTSRLPLCALCDIHISLSISSQNYSSLGQILLSLQANLHLDKYSSAFSPIFKMLMRISIFGLLALANASPAAKRGMPVPYPQFLLSLISSYRSQLRYGDDRPIQRCQLRRKRHPRRQPAQQTLRLPPPRDPRRQIHHPKPRLQSVLQRPCLRQCRVHALHEHHDRRPHDTPSTLFFQWRGRFPMRDGTRSVYLQNRRAPHRRLHRLPGQPNRSFQLRRLYTTKAIHRHLPFILHQQHRVDSPTEHLLGGQHVHQRIPRQWAADMVVQDVDFARHARPLLPLHICRVNFRY